MSLRNRRRSLLTNVSAEFGRIAEVLESRQLLASVQVAGHAAIVAKYAALPDSVALLGSSVGSERLTANGSGLYQSYRFGAIMWSASTGAHEVHGAIVVRYFELGGPNGVLGLPKTDEVDTPQRDGRMNTFERGLISYNYASGKNSAVQGAIATKYFALGGPMGFLGVPTSNEMDTPDHLSRTNSFEGGVIVRNKITGVITVIPNTQAVRPTINLLTPPKFKEGDVFTVTVMDGSPGQIVNVQVLWPNNTLQLQFPSIQIDSNGNATIALRIPYFLNGAVAESRTIRVITDNGFTRNFPITLNEGQRVKVSSDTIQEGKNLAITVANGVGKSPILAQLIDLSARVVHEWPLMQTDAAGKGTYSFTIPALLSIGTLSKVYDLRVVHGGAVTDQRVTVTAGIGVGVGVSVVREKVSIFPLTVRNTVPNATVTLKWYLGTVLRATQSFRTGINGSGNFTVTAPSNLISNSATTATFRLVATVSGQSIPATFSILVHKYTAGSSGLPDPGVAQSLITAPLAVPTNAASGIGLNTPITFGVKNVLLVNKTQSAVFGADDPSVALRDRMKHQLVILCYGSDQHPGNPLGPILGMDLVFEKIQGVTGRSHVMRLWSGDKSFNPGQDLANAAAAKREAILEITQTMSLLKGLGETITSVVIAGYSWGGGMARELANWMKTTYRVEISGLVYVDAVTHGIAGHQTSLPTVKPSSFLNIYQSVPTILDDTVALGNGHIANYGLAEFDGATFYRRYREIDTDIFGVSFMDHGNIDNKQATVVAEFINGVLHGWYGLHP